jgi:transketolase
MNYDSKNPKWDGRDRFILSKAQASPLLYAILADLGFFDKSWLDTFSKDKFSVHLQNDVPGVEISAGSLGMGLGIACGMAYALKQDLKKELVFCLMGDAECYEGSVWEAALSASHNNLNNLVCIIDRNWMGATDFTEDMCQLSSLKNKFDSFDWETKEIDGHNLQEVYDSLKNARSRQSGKPLMIIANTVKGNTCPLMIGNRLYHSRVPECNECKLECEVQK